jgi:hypothetical protein
MTLDVAPEFTLETTMRIRGDAGVLETTGSGSAVPVRRFDASPWRDPRLIAGILIVVASTAVGGWTIAAADDTVGYWATRGSVRAGARSTATTSSWSMPRFRPVPLAASCGPTKLFRPGSATFGGQRMHALEPW